MDRSEIEDTGGFKDMFKFILIALPIIILLKIIGADKIGE